jgi:hypothetical protein
MHSETVKFIQPHSSFYSSKCYVKWIIKFLYKIWVSQSGVAEVSWLLGCDAASMGMCWQHSKECNAIKDEGIMIPQNTGNYTQKNTVLIPDDLNIHETPLFHHIIPHIAPCHISVYDCLCISQEYWALNIKLW